MRTCWVLDHPAHVRLLAEYLRNGTTADLIVACERPEVRAMLENGDGRLPRRQTLWVPRPVGEGRKRKAVYRISSVQRFLKAAGQDGQGPVERIVGVGAALEMMAAKPRWWRRSSVRERWYITDTEINHLAHRLAMKSATHVVVPTHWRGILTVAFSLHLAARFIAWTASTLTFISFRIEGPQPSLHLLGWWFVAWSAAAYMTVVNSFQFREMLLTGWPS